MRSWARSATGCSLSKHPAEGRSLATAASLSDSLLATARLRLRRLSASEAREAHAAGALLVDIRSAEQRLRDGAIPGAIPIDRTTLEWRLDPTSPFRVEAMRDIDVEVVLICAEGYSSSLAAASLLDMGLRHVTDVAGGFDAWRAAGLPVDR